MKREYTKARLGSERTSKGKKPLDHLTRDVLAAQAAGMSYGQWKALHPYTAAEDDEPEELTVDPSKRALVCIRCGKTFLASNRQANQKYCGDNCRYQAQLDRQRQLHPEEHQPRQCRVCGKILPDNHKGIYCSYECRGNAYRKKDMEKHPEKYVPKPCPVCGTLFVGTYGRKYCSELCQKRYLERQRRNRKKEAAENGST